MSPIHRWTHAIQCCLTITWKNLNNNNCLLTYHMFWGIFRLFWCNMVVLWSRALKIYASSHISAGLFKSSSWVFEVKHDQWRSPSLHRVCVRVMDKFYHAIWFEKKINEWMLYLFIFYWEYFSKISLLKSNSMVKFGHHNFCHKIKFCALLQFIYIN